MVTVNWSKLHDAKCVWEAHGYQYIETPYWVTREAIEMTFPADVEPHKNRYHVEGTDRYLVASGEQGFAQMMIDGTLPPGRYCTIGPCFRDDAIDELHQNHFVKLEIIDTTGSASALGDMISTAQELFSYMCLSKPVLVEYQGGYDIEIAGVEVGSYGFREANGFGWAYGTGLAEPRLSIAVERDCAAFSRSNN